MIYLVRDTITGLFWEGSWKPLDEQWYEVSAVALGDDKELVCVRSTAKVPGVFNRGDRVRLTKANDEVFHGRLATVLRRHEEAGRLWVETDEAIHGNKEWSSKISSLEHA